jgi:hypothetical protein
MTSSLYLRTKLAITSLVNYTHTTFQRYGTNRHYLISYLHVVRCISKFYMGTNPHAKGMQPITKVPMSGDQQQEVRIRIDDAPQVDFMQTATNPIVREIAPNAQVGK